MDGKERRGSLLFQPLYILTALFYGFYFAMMGFYVIQLPYFFKSVVGFSPFQIGILFGMMPLAKFLTPFWFLKKGLEEWELKLGIAIGVVGGVLLFTLNFYLLLIAFFLLGVSFSILPPFVERVAVERLGHHYGRSRLIGSLTFLSGGFIHPPGIGVLGVVFGLLIISSLLSLLIYHHHTAQKRGPDPLEFSFKKGWHFWVALVVMKTATVGFYTFFTIYMHQHGLGEYVGVFWLVSIVVEVALFLAQPKVMAHLSPMGAMGISLLATALRWFILCLFPDSFWMVLFSQLLHATTFALFHIGAMSFLNSTYPNKTLAQQFYGGLGYGLSWFLGSWLAGLLYPYHLFCWEGVLTLIAFGILEMGRGRRGS